MDDAYKYALGQVLKSKRQEAGLSKQQFALMVGICRLTLRKIEHGKANPTASTLLRITSGLGVSLADVAVEAERALRKADDCPPIPKPLRIENGKPSVTYFVTQL